MSTSESIVAPASELMSASVSEIGSQTDPLNSSESIVAPVSELTRDSVHEVGSQTDPLQRSEINMEAPANDTVQNTGLQNLLNRIRRRK